MSVFKSRQINRDWTYVAATKSSNTLPYKQGRIRSVSLLRKKMIGYGETNLLLPDTTFMPLLTKLTAAPDVRNREDGAVRLQKREHSRAEERVYGNGESAVP